MQISRTTFNPFLENIFWLWITLFIVALGFSQFAHYLENRQKLTPGDYPRYPYRLPDWFWQSPQNADLMTPQEVIATKKDILKLEGLPDSLVKQTMESNIAHWLASKFSLQDLIKNSHVISNPKIPVSVAVLIDPSFDVNTRIMLQDAMSRFIEVAFDPVVIKKAFDRSTQTPAGMPVNISKQEITDFDETDHTTYAEGNELNRQQKTKPTSVNAFLMQLSHALTTPTGDPAVLMISRYSGDAWWGGAYNNFYSMPLQQLKGEGASCGYLYIRLNSDKLANPEPGWNDVNFWASKIAHELLHNLGYWHPNYQHPADRDVNNRENAWSFVVSYEFAILEKLNRKPQTVSEEQHKATRRKQAEQGVLQGLEAVPPGSEVLKPEQFISG